MKTGTLEVVVVAALFGIAITGLTVGTERRREIVCPGSAVVKQVHDVAEVCSALPGETLFAEAGGIKNGCA